MTAGGIVIATSIPPRMERMNEGRPIGDAYQKLCLESWVSCGFRIVSVNDREEIPGLAARFPGVEFVATDRNASVLTGRKNPYIADLLTVLAHSPEDIVGIANSDLIFQPSTAWREQLPKYVDNAVVVGQRFNMQSLENGALFPFKDGFDYFFFERSIASELAEEAFPYAMGVPWWDFWLPLALAFKGRRILTAQNPIILHLHHAAAYRKETMEQMGHVFTDFVLRHAENNRQPSMDITPILHGARAFKDLSPTVIGDAREESIGKLALSCPSVLAAHPITLLPDKGGSPQEVEMDRASAAAFFRQVEERVSATAHMRDAIICESLNKFDEADALYMSATRLAPKDGSLLLHCGNYFYSRGKLDSAADILLAAVDWHVIPPDALYGVGAALLEQREWKKAEEIIVGLEKVLAATPGHSAGAELYHRLRGQLPSKGGAVPIYYSRSGEDVLLEAFFGEKPTGFFVDIGAGNGIEGSNSYVFEKRGWSGICVEPSPRHYAACTVNRPRSQWFQMVCVKNEKISHVDVGKAQLGLEGYGAVSVPATTLNALLQEVPKLDFVSIAAEGALFDVLGGMDFSRYEPRVFCIETTTDAERNILDKFFTSKGYSYARSLNRALFYVRSDKDKQMLRAIKISSKLARAENEFAYVYWPAEI